MVRRPLIGDDNMKHESINRADDAFLDFDAACQFWGGNRPLNRATIYRQIAAGQHPKPVKIGHLSRFLKSELLAERDRRIAARDLGEAA